MYNKMRQEINDIETIMEEVVQMYGQRMSARAGQVGNRLDKEGEALGREWHGWAVTMHQHNEDESRESAKGCGGQEC